MNRLQIVQRVRALTRDFTNSIFRENDIVDFLNEGINRFKQIIPELKELPELLSKSQIPFLIPEQYRHLLAVYAAARCFGQDERHYQASTLMNEFEVKLNELKEKIENGEIQIVDADGQAVENDIPVDYVNMRPYWHEHSGVFNLKDIDEGVEGVE